MSARTHSPSHATATPAAGRQTGGVKRAVVSQMTAEVGTASPGRPLDFAIRRRMEQHFGQDFSRVRVHTDTRAAESARTLGALAYTLGSHVAFGAGQYQRDASAGLRLLTHEMAHVAQWGNVGSPPVAPAALRARSDSGGAESALEREAEAAAVQFERGEPAVVRGGVRQAIPLLHPVYISRHGDQGFLNQANNFFTRWGYSPITTGVDSIEEVVADLATKSSIGRVTIVSHAHPSNIFMAFLSGGPSQIRKEDWDADLVDPSLTPQEQQSQGPDLGELTLLERHFIGESTLDTVIQGLQNDPQHAAVLARIGSGTDPIVREFVWWAIEFEFVDNAGFSQARKRLLKAHITAVLNSYRDTMLVALASVAGFGGTGGGPVGDAEFAALRAAVHAVTQMFVWDRPSAALQRQIVRQLTGSPSEEINRVLRDPDFANNLTTVRANISGASWIEVQGCRIGQDPGYLDGMKRFFTGPQGSPAVSAPDWFQFFGNYGFRRPVANNAATMRRLWRQKRVRDALAHWHPIVTGQELPDTADADTLKAYLEGPNVLPLLFPGQRGAGSEFLLLAGMVEEAFLAWFALHSYRLTSEQDIETQLYTQQGPAQNIRHTTVDWLQERRRAPTNMLFRPDPAYQQHIITV
jgi:hypothetical protein